MDYSVHILCYNSQDSSAHCGCREDQPPTQTRGLKRKFSEKVPLVLLKDFVSKFLGEKKPQENILAKFHD